MHIERASEDSDSEDGMSPVPADYRLLTPSGSSQSWREGDFFCIRSFYSDHAYDRRPVHELHATTEEDTSGS